MLETPLVGRYSNEGRKLVFGPPVAYSLLVRIVLWGGILMALVGGFIAPTIGIELPLYREWWQWVGVGLGFSGGLAAMSMSAVMFDLRAKAYSRRQGPGLFKQITRGGLDRLDAIVLVTEPNGRLTAGSVTYHLVLHWKARAEPLLVLGTYTSQLPMGVPLETGAGPLREIGRRYAESLGLMFYDNAHFPSPRPV